MTTTGSPGRHGPTVTPVLVAELLPGVRLVPTPGHTPGSQVGVVQTGGGVRS